MIRPVDRPSKVEGSPAFNIGRLPRIATMPGLNILQNGPVKHSPTEESAAEVLANLSVQSVIPQTKVVPELTVDGKHNFPPWLEMTRMLMLFKKFLDLSHTFSNGQSPA